MVNYKNMRILFIPQKIFNQVTFNVKKNYIYIQMMGLSH